MTTATVATTPRFRKALELAARAAEFIPGDGEPGTYLVPASDGQGYYRVDADGCGCPDATQRNTVCKHQMAVAMVRVGTVAVIVNAARTAPPCTRCGEPAKSAASKVSTGVVGTTNAAPTAA